MAQKLEYDFGNVLPGNAGRGHARPGGRNHRQKCGGSLCQVDFRAHQHLLRTQINGKAQIEILTR